MNDALTRGIVAVTSWAQQDSQGYWDEVHAFTDSHRVRVILTFADDFGGRDPTFVEKSACPGPFQLDASDVCQQIDSLDWNGCP